MAQTLEERFWSKVRVTKNGCWYWKASKDRNGYGMFNLKIEGRVSTCQAAHRVAFYLEYSYWPECVRHTCDMGHKGCVRPSHLEPGSLGDNVKDMFTRQRDTLACCIISTEDREYILNYEPKTRGWPQKLAKKLGYNEFTIYEMWRRYIRL